MKNTDGFTLVEALTALAVIAILLGAALPGMGDWIHRHRDRTTLQNFQHLVAFARNAAITHTQVVTLCPSEDGHVCSEDWSQPLLVFTDPDRNEVLDPGDQLLRSERLPSERCLQWRASAQKHYLQFKPTGASNGIAGHFRFCETVDNAIEYKVVVALTGRTALRKL